IFISNYKEVRKAVLDVGAKKKDNFILLSNSNKNVENFIKIGKITKIKDLSFSLDYDVGKEVLSKNI
ncbi:MAG: hypothetical protein QXD23_03860, partial [Candidatus Micrarchaeaceae archaeon]